MPRDFGERLEVRLIEGSCLLSLSGVFAIEQDDVIG